MNELLIGMCTVAVISVAVLALRYLHSYSEGMIWVVLLAVVASLAGCWALGKLILMFMIEVRP